TLHDVHPTSRLSVLLTYTAETQRPHVLVVSPHTAIAVFYTLSLHDALPISSDTPRIVKLRSLKFWYAFTRFGFSFRQGPHQDAQKSISTYLPRKSERLTGWSLTSFWVNSGAVDPIGNKPSLNKRALTFAPAAVLCNSGDRLAKIRFPVLRRTPEYECASARSRLT